MEPKGIHFSRIKIWDISIAILARKEQKENDLEVKIGDVIS